MKKRVLLIALIAGGSFLALNSFRNGPAANGYNCTGSENGHGNPTGCATGPTGCHGTLPSNLDVTVRLDSAGLWLDKYVPGNTYTVSVSATNHTHVLYPKFGFQVSVIKGEVPTAAPLNAGVLQKTGLPATMHYVGGNTATRFANIMEHTDPIAATTGTGDSGSTYVQKFLWRAPYGMDTISIWGVLNMVNGDGSIIGDVWDTHHIVLTRRFIPASVGTTTSGSISVFPNPAIDQLNIQLGTSISGEVTVTIADMMGRQFGRTAHQLSGVAALPAISVADLAPGQYVAIIEGEGIRRSVQFIKQ